MSAVDIILVIVIILVAVYFISLNQDQLAIAKFDKERIEKNKADKERNKKLGRKNITWTKKEKLAYIKNLISLSASDGSIDKSEQEVFLKILLNENLMPGVEEFLKNKDRNWKIIKSNRGNLNKITNSDQDIPGFYMYKVIN